MFFKTKTGVPDFELLRATWNELVWEKIGIRVMASGGFFVRQVFFVRQIFSSGLRRPSYGVQVTEQYSPGIKQKEKYVFKTWRHSIFHVEFFLKQTIYVSKKNKTTTFIVNWAYMTFQEKLEKVIKMTLKAKNCGKLLPNTGINHTVINKRLLSLKKFQGKKFCHSGKVLWELS